MNNYFILVHDITEQDYRVLFYNIPTLELAKELVETYINDIFGDNWYDYVKQISHNFYDYNVSYIIGCEKFFFAVINKLGEVPKGYMYLDDISGIKEAFGVYLK